MFIDIHCHILPDTDDGADSFSDTEEIVSTASLSGTTIMVITPHYNNRTKCKHNYSKSVITEKYKHLLQKLNKINDSTKFFLGSELLADENMQRLLRTNDFITINNSRYILTEFYFDEELKKVNNYIDQIKAVGLVPIIAHPERYSFSSNISDIELIANKGCKFQINKDSLLGRYGKREKATALKMLNNDLVHFIASDCHNNTSRNADLSELYVKMLENFSQKKINNLFHDNQKRVLLDIDF